MVSLNLKSLSISLFFLSSVAFAMEKQDRDSAATREVAVGVIPVTENNKADLMNMVKGLYEAEGCGICKKPGADGFWFSPYSRCAHTVCFNLVKKAEHDLEELIIKMFAGDDNWDKNCAHIAAIKAVEKAMQEVGVLSIKDYLEKYGEEKLTHLFNTEGKEAVITYWCGKRRR